MENFFAQNFRYLRKTRNITQWVLSEYIGKAHTTIGNWERNFSEPNIEELLKISEYFHISLDDMIAKNLHSEKFITKKAGTESEKPKALPMDDSISKLLNSQQLNIETLQQLLSVKNDEIEKLRMENNNLKQKKSINGNEQTLGYSRSH